MAMAGAQIQSLTWDLPSTTGAAIKRELERQRERQKRETTTKDKVWDFTMINGSKPEESITFININAPKQEYVNIESKY